MVDEFAKDISRTLSLSNQYLMMLLEKSGLKGLVPSHGDILFELFACDEISMSELSRRIDRDPSTVTVLVRKLVAMGLAQTTKSPSDRRSTMVSLTDKGQGFKDDFVAISEQMSSVWRRGLSEVDVETTQRVLAMMRDNLNEAIEKEAIGEEALLKLRF